MKLLYTTPKGDEKDWFVEELQEGARYKLVDEAGKPRFIEVDHTADRARTIAFFDGFVIEDNDVYCVSLLSLDPKIKVGHSPRFL